MEEVKPNVKPRKKNPLDNANICSYMLFCWLLPFFAKNYKKELTEDDMYMHRKSHECGSLGNQFEVKWNKQLTKKNPSVINALVGQFSFDIILLNTVLIISETIRLCQPFLLTKLIHAYESNNDEEDKNEIYLYSFLIVITLFLVNNTTHIVNLLTAQFSIKLRVTVCSLMYRKSLKLSKSALVETTIGQMVNLLSNDVARFDISIFYLFFTYVAPVEMLIVMYMLYINVGITGLVGAVLLILMVPFQFWLGKKTSKFRLQTAIRTDERVRLMNEIISGIQVIKMYTWEYSFTKLVDSIRMNEMKHIRNNSTIRAILMSCALLLNRSAVAICILVYVITGNTLTATYAYAITSYYRLLYTVTNYFPSAISLAAELYVSTKRIEKFLLYDEVQAEQKNALKDVTGNASPVAGERGKQNQNENVSVYIKNASVKWLKSQAENNLENINIHIAAGSVVAIIGPVGSGKTTLLHVIMKELQVQNGSVHVNGTVSYASQEPWLFGGSIRQNILFGENFDQARYNEVVKVCALDRDFTLFPHGDRTLTGERGVALSGGQRARINLARAIYKEADIYLLDDPLSAVDTHVAKQLFYDCVRGYLRRKCVILVTHQLQFLKEVKYIYLMNNGTIEASGSYSSLKESGAQYGKLLTEIEEEDEALKRKSAVNVTEISEEHNDIQVLQKEARATGKISGHVYTSYARAGGHFIKVILLAFAFLVSQVLDSGAEYFVSYWVNIQQQNNFTKTSGTFNVENVTLSTNISKIISVEDRWLTPMVTDNTTTNYSILVFSIIIFVLLRSLAFYKWCLRASMTLHNKMLANVVYSPMKFFSDNPTGRILNRFSKDIGLIDESLPGTLLDTIQIGLMVIANSVVIGTLTIWILIPTVLIGVLFYFLRVVYVQTSRNVKRIESVTRSPIFTHLSASLQGLTTIRAFKAQDILKKEFDNYQNINSSACFLYLGCARTFAYWLDFFCAIYVTLVITSLIFIEKEQFGGNVGLALTQAMGITGILQVGMRQWSEFENQLTSVERVQEYADLIPEEEIDNKISKTWPEAGKIEFSNMSLKYVPEGPYVVRDLNFVIHPNEKVGIVGRTGAGKSSLIHALFRLAYIDGSITIDGIDTKTIRLKDLRHKISIIPQEPVIFSGTLKKNLDPFGEYEDEILWNALEEVELKHVVAELPSGLDTRIAEGGSNFSVGQRQLVCLARAIIRNNKILILDEATASVDLQTDSLIQTTIRKKFSNCTVLTIAHRLQTIIDSDKVLVMDAGEAVEFDHPYVLLQNTAGVFYSLVEKTGRSTAKNLIAIAEHKKKTNKQCEKIS